MDEDGLYPTDAGGDQRMGQGRELHWKLPG